MNGLKKYVNGIKYIKIIFFVVVILFVAISASGIFKEIMNSYYQENIDIGYWIYPIAFVESIIIGIIDNAHLVGFYIILILVSRSINRTRLDESDFEKNKKLYRDTIKNYSVSVLNYIDNFKLDYRQSYTAKLLELQKKKIIKINNNRIEIISEPEEELDKLFVSSIKDNKVTIPLYEYEKLVEKEAFEKGLITNASFLGILKDKKMRNMIMIVLFLIIGGVCFISAVQEGDIASKIFIGAVLLFFVINFFITFIATYYFIYCISSFFVKRYRRTEKGKEINRQLDGLKLFMEKFSNIDNRDSQHLVLWDDYLIYSVMFNINKKVQDEYAAFFTNN